MRISTKDLENRVAYLNQLTNNNPEPYSKKVGKLCANIGTYYIDCAYGGCQLVQIVNNGGGVKNILHTGYTTKKDLYYNINSYIAGISN